jgi:hypothetical protein
MKDTVLAVVIAHALVIVGFLVLVMIGLLEPT